MENKAAISLIKVPISYMIKFVDTERSGLVENERGQEIISNQQCFLTMGMVLMCLQHDNGRCVTEFSV